MMHSRLFRDDSTIEERSAMRMDLCPRSGENTQVPYDEVRKWIFRISLPVCRD